MTDVIYTAAHGGFSLEHVPLGGGAAICDHLVAEWNQTKPFPLTLVDPSVLGASAPKHKDLVSLSELDYARFCLRFEAVSTERIAATDPTSTVVLANDVSEGPDFKTLSEKGHRIFTIYHVDVVDYFTRIYLRGLIRPEQLAGAYARISETPFAKLLPKIAGLVVQKQQDSVRYSEGLIVPSTAMKEVLLTCYPGTDPAKIHVLPWGVWETRVPEQAVADDEAALRAQYHIPKGAQVLLTLSRISPEKGQDRLLKALALLENRSDYSAGGICLFLAGEAAYMRGKKFERQLRALARRLTKTQVIFPGYAGSVRKEALFRMADLYVFPSRHESYGLTAMEAMRAGKPILSCYDHGTREVMRPELGVLLPDVPEEQVPTLLSEALAKLLARPEALKKMGEAARRHAQAHRFSDTAAKLADLLVRA